MRWNVHQSDLDTQYFIPNFSAVDGGAKINKAFLENPKTVFYNVIAIVNLFRNQGLKSGFVFYTAYPFSPRFSLYNRDS